MRIKRLGDHALVIQFGASISKGSHAKVMSYYHHLLKKETIGISDLIPAYNSLTLVYDPSQITFRELDKILIGIQPEMHQNSGFEVQIPICYELALDQETFCSSTGFNWEEITGIHLEKRYLIYMMGFLPGFLYMGDVDSRIQLPRKREPRKKIEKGSVGIADSQTGIYSIESPGGWNIIGKSPVSLFTPGSKHVFPVEIGDEAAFFRINQKEFELISNDKNYKIERISAGK